ncbi:MAG: DUF1850 domain-containing protein [Gemmobacter sp.]
MICAGALVLTAAAFTLEWTHSVEHGAWQEDWTLRDGALVLTAARVKGSGAGMEPGTEARLRDGWLEWHPSLPAQRQIVLAASGATGGGWRICATGECHDLGSGPGAPLIVRPCGADGG